MKNFIIRIGVSTCAAVLFGAVALAQVTAPTTGAQPLGRQAQNKKSLDPVCMQNATVKRDDAIIAGLDTFSSSVKVALQTRRDSLKAAWAITDNTQRKTAIKTAWTAFQGTWKKTKQAMRNAKKTAWQQFRTERKACGSVVISNDQTGESVDAGL